MTEDIVKEGKNIALVSYIWLFGVIIAFYMNNDKKNAFASFHIRQSLGLWLTYMIFAYMVGYFDSLMISMPFWIFFGVLFIYSFVTAVAGKAYPIPLVGNLYQKIFSGLGK